MRIFLRAFFVLSFVFLSAFISLAAANSNQESKISRNCDSLLKSFSNQELIHRFSEKIKTFSEHINHPDFSGKSLMDSMNRMGETLKSNPQRLEAFHKDFHEMMKSFDEMKKLSLTERDAQQTFAITVNKAILSRSFVASYLVAQVTEKFLSNRSFIENQKYYSAEDADILIYSVLGDALNTLDKDDDDWTSNSKDSKKITTLDLAKKLAESLEENSIHPDSLLGGTQILLRLFSKDAGLRAEAAKDWQAKAERAARLREVFQKKWIESNSN